jgi:integrase/recombinase XerD
MALQSSSAVLSGFLDYLKIEKGLAALTISAYNSDLCQFSEFLEKRERSILKAQRTDVREFLQQLFSHQVDGRSVGRKLSALRHLYRYLLLDKKLIMIRRWILNRPGNGRCCRRRWHETKWRPRWRLRLQGRP